MSVIIGASCIHVCKHLGAPSDYHNCRKGPELIGIFFKTCDLELPASRKEEEATAQRIDLKISAKVGEEHNEAVQLRRPYPKSSVQCPEAISIFEFSRQIQQQLSVNKLSLNGE